MLPGYLSCLVARKVTAGFHSVDIINFICGDFFVCEIAAAEMDVNGVKSLGELNIVVTCASCGADFRRRGNVGIHPHHSCDAALNLALDYDVGRAKAPLRTRFG